MPPLITMLEPTLNAPLNTIDARATILIAALTIDAALGEPKWLWGRFPHPVILFGHAIAALENRLNKRGGKTRPKGRNRRCRGTLAMLILIALAAAIGAGIGACIQTITHTLNIYAASIYGIIIEAVLVAILLAARSLDQHTRPIAKALDNNNIKHARALIALVVGRNTESLNASQIAKAAIETTAENLSDGVIAPAIFYLSLGLPGLIAYKIINTADSMIGYKSKDYLAFGTAAAKIDDAANIIPARITALLITLAAPKKNAIGVIFRDAPKHRSPNAGWCEAAMATALNLRLAEPRIYGQRRTTDAPINPKGRTLANPQDIIKALAIMWRAITIFAAILLMIALT